MLTLSYLTSKRQAVAAPDTALIQHSVFTCRSCSTVRHAVPSSCGDANTTERHRAREIATFSLFGENRNSIPRGMCSPLDDASEISTTAASCPWNLSTVPTRAPGGRTSFNRLTCMLYGLTTRMSSSPIGFSTPSPLVHV